MGNVGVFMLAGLGIGAVYAALALGLVITFKGTGIINFAAGAMGVWCAYVFSELRSTGHLTLPIVWLPSAVHVADRPGVILSIALAAMSGALLGLLAHLLVFRPLRNAPDLAKVVASAGVMLAVQALVVQRFGNEPRVVDPILSSAVVKIYRVGIPAQIFWLAGVVVVIAFVVGAWFRFARYGLAMRAAAENEFTVSLARYSPDRLAAVAWIASSAVVGFLAVLAAPITGLNSTSYTLYVVPALACALVGRLTFIGPAVIAGFVLGMINSEITYFSTKTWWPSWVSSSAFGAVPFFAIIIVLFVAGKSLPTRDAVRPGRLPRVPRPHPRPTIVGLFVVAALVVLALTGGVYRFGIVTSMAMAIVTLSIVLLTGMLGQVSLAQAAFAGIGGFTLSKLSVAAGIGFPWAPLLSALVAGAFGVVAGLPALRIRGAQLAVVTISMSLAFEQIVFSNTALNGFNGNPVPQPRLPGLDLSVRRGSNIARLPFAILCLVLLLAVAIGVANIARSATGRRFLAVRSNERASASIGVSVTGTKLVGFAMSAFLAGLGGTLIAYSHGTVSVQSFTTLVGISWLLFAYLGGITSIGGALQAATFVPLGVAYVLVNRFIGTSSNSYLLFSAVLLIASVIFNPDGMAAGLARRIEQLRGRRHRRGQEGTSAAADLELTSSMDVSVIATVPTARRALVSRTAAPLLEVNSISVSFGGVRAISDVTLHVPAGQIIGLIGANGAGKTTFIDAVSGFVPYRGSMSLGGQPIDGLAAHRRALRGLARTWQSSELFVDLTVRENLLVASEPSRLHTVALDCVRPRRGDEMVVRRCLAAAGIESLADRFPGELSLGEQKLVNVARALAREPRVILMDEPAAGLSAVETAELSALVISLVDDLGIGVLLVEHDVGFVTDLCDHVHVLDFGQTIASGTAAEVRDDPHVIEAYLGTGFAVTHDSATAS